MFTLVANSVTYTDVIACPLMTLRHICVFDIVQQFHASANEPNNAFTGVEYMISVYNH